MTGRIDDDARNIIQARYMIAYELFRVKDPITHYHSLRVSEVGVRFCIFLGEFFGLPVDLLQNAFYMHDFGKIGILNRILKSKKSFAPESKERKYYINSHSQVGAELLKGLPKSIINVARDHQEKWDGTGYLRGLKGKKIPLEARIAGLVDALDAIIAKRNYKEEETLARGLKKIKKDSGSHFDPELVENLDLYIQTGGQEVDDIFLNLYPFSLVHG